MRTSGQKGKRFMRACKDGASSGSLSVTIENQGERISISGSLQIHQDQHSLEHAKILMKILEQTVITLESQNLVIKVEQNHDDVEVVKNPFWNDSDSK